MTHRFLKLLKRQMKIMSIVCLLVMTGGNMIMPRILAFSERSVWDIETVDSIGYVGEFTSLALDASGYPHISYYGAPDADLKYAYQDGGGWHISIVDSTGTVGAFTSLALDTNGYPHISYSGNTDLKYAYQDGVGWHTSTVDSTGTVGAFTSLALETNGYPHISYLDTTNGDLRYAYQDGGGWHISTVDSTWYVGEDTSLALDSSGYPHISYYDVTNGDLKYAYKDGGGWHISTVDGTGNVGEYASLALDSSGYPHISYRDGTIGYSGDLKYAYMDSGGWHISTVDGTGNVGYFTSLALDTSGYPCISYQDGTSGDLKYAYLYPVPPVISAVQATPLIQVAGGEVTVSCNVTDNGGVADARVNITYPDSSSVNVSMSLRGDYIYTATYTLSGTYTYFIWANDTHGSTAISGLYQFTIVTTDYLKITYHSQNEILSTILSTNFTLDCYAGAFNDTYGFITFVDATWNLQNSGGSNASLNTSSGKSVAFFSGWYDGTVTVTADDGSGHSDSVVFTVDQSAFSMMINGGWNNIGWSQDYDTDAATLGQYISGCTVVCKFNSNSQSFTTHVVGIPYNEFTITKGMGLFIYTTEGSIWDGTDGT